MPAYDSRVDAYIQKSAGFARPVLGHLRNLIHETCPGVRETLKWGMPYYEYKGLLCGFAAFKQNCSFGFWKSALLADPHGVLRDGEKAAMGSFGRIGSLDDLPADPVLHALIRDAMRVNDEAITVPAAHRKRGGTKAPMPEPEYLTALLAEHETAKSTWDGLPPSHRREYLEWLTEAKTQATRARRLTQMLDLLAGGRSRHWKYKR